MELLRNTTGVDLQELVGRYASGSPAGTSPGTSPASGAPAESKD